MFVDYHVHLDKLDWTMDTIDEICKKASKSNVDKVGIVIHTKILNSFEPLYEHILQDKKNHKKLKFDKNIDEYVDLIQKAKNIGYPVLCGIEVCYCEEGEEFLKEKLINYPFDYKIGSVHLIGNMHYKNAVLYYQNVYEAGKVYYEIILKAIKSGLFDIIGHIENVRREGILPLSYYPELLNDIAENLKKLDCALEINTKWLRKHGYIAPEKDTLSYLKQSGVKLVFGSDAHHKKSIGFAKYIAELSIRDAGYREFSAILK